MQNDLATQITGAIHEELADYLTGKQSLREFRDWFFPETWDIHQWAPRVQQLVYGITLLIHEYTSDVWSEEQLKDKLRRFLTFDAEMWNGFTGSN